MLFDPRMLSLYAARVSGSEVLADRKLALLGALGRHLVYGRSRRRALAILPSRCLIADRRSAFSPGRRGRARRWRLGPGRTGIDAGGLPGEWVGGWPLPDDAARRSSPSSSGPLTRSFSSLPTLKNGSRFSCTDTGTPVFGLRPW